MRRKEMKEPGMEKGGKDERKPAFTEYSSVSHTTVGALSQEWDVGFNFSSDLSVNDVWLLASLFPLWALVLHLEKG